MDKLTQVNKIQGKEKLVSNIPKFARGVSRAILFFLIVILAIAIFAIIWVSLIPTDDFLGANSIHDVSNLYVGYIDLADVNLAEFATTTEAKSFLISSMAFSVAIILPLLVIGIYIVKLANSISLGQIFTQSTSKSILAIAITVTISMFIDTNINALFSMLVAKPFFYEYVHGATDILGMYRSTALSVDLYDIMIVSALFLLYYAFKEGERMQRLSDETL